MVNRNRYYRPRRGYASRPAGYGGYGGRRYSGRRSGSFPARSRGRAWVPYNVWRARMNAQRYGRGRY